MAGFLLKRLIQAVFVMVVVTLVVSFAIRLTGDPASPALYVAATAAITFASTFFIRPTRLAGVPALATS